MGHQVQTLGEEAVWGRIMAKGCRCCWGIVVREMRWTKKWSHVTLNGEIRVTETRFKLT